MRKFNTNELLDSWQASGSGDFAPFYEALELIDASTDYVEVDTANVVLFTFREVIDEKAISGYEHGKNTVQKFIPLDELRMKGMTDELLDELVNQSKIMITAGNGDYMFTTPHLHKTLAQIAGCPVGKAASRDEIAMRFHRDALYACYMRTVNQKCHIIYREGISDNGKTVRKAVGILTDRHGAIGQKESIQEAVTRLEAEFGKAELKSWHVNNLETECYVEFPEKAAAFTKVMKDGNAVNLPDEVVPGAFIRTADCGNSSFTVIGTTRVGKRGMLYVPGAAYNRAHTKNATVAAIGEALTKTVFKEFRRIPDRLCELLSIDIADPVAAITKVVAASKMQKTLSFDIARETVDNLTAQINPNVPCTAYDLAQLFLEQGARVESQRTRYDSIAKVRNCFAKAVFFKYEDLA